MHGLIVIPGPICGGLVQGTGNALPGHWLLDTGTMLMRVSAGFRAVLGIGETSPCRFKASWRWSTRMTAVMWKRWSMSLIHIPRRPSMN
jgi:hypothetical protein